MSTVNYKEVSATGSSWVRALAVNISNPLNGTPRISFHEEKVVQLGEGNIVKVPEPRYLSKEFNPTETFELINPETNEPLGQTISHLDIYVMLYSLYIKTATDEDARIAAEAAALAALQAEAQNQTVYP